MERDLISVIIPIHNTEKYLKDCLESIIKQTYQNIEIILVDDGSTDNSGKICDEYSRKLDKIIVIHQKQQGASVARNNGIEKSKGEYITFVDSDDIVEEKYIEYLYNLIKKYQTKIAISSNKIISENNKEIDIGCNYEEKVMKTEECLDRLLREKGFTVSPWAKMYHRTLFENVRFPNGKLFEDNETTYKLIMECNQIAYGNRSYYIYYRRKDSSTRSKFNIKKLDLIELTDNICDEIQKKYPNLKESTEKRKITVRFSILRMINYKETNDEVNKKRNEIETYIKQRKQEIFKNKSMDTRDKIALICLLISKKFFYFSWNIYCKIKY